jgi:hypothetical protein
MTKPARSIALALALALAVPPVITSSQPAVAAEPTKEAKDEASTRFKNGLELFKEGDYRAALIEFRRAYELVPNYSVLYNIGQVHMQLQDYAGALTALQGYLTDGGSAIQGDRRAEVEKDVEKLRSRVARIEIITNPADADVTIDDVAVGKTPLAKPVLTNPGRHRISASKAGRTSASRQVEVASSDSIKVTLDLPELTSTEPVKPIDQPQQPAVQTTPVQPQPTPVTPPAPQRTIPWAGWVVTGGLTAGAVVCGVLALGAASDLKAKREPTSGATRDELDSAGKKTSSFALATDLLGGAAIVAGAVTLYFTVRTPPAPEGAAAKPATGGIQQVKVGVSPGGVRLVGSF